MVIKPSLSLGLRQQLTMTPQLQQAIRLLQLSAMDLQREIQEALETNPMLEEESEGGDGLEAATAEDPGPTEGGFGDASRDNADDFSPYAIDAGDLRPDSDHTDRRDSGPITADSDGGMLAEPEAPGVDRELARPIPEELPVDSDWDDVFQPAAAQADPATGGGDRFPDIDNNRGAEETLQDHLLWQLNLTPLSDTERLIALAIIHAVNPDGMLEADIDELLGSFASQLGIDADDVLRVLRRVQQFDPTGVAARNLSECLALQLEALDAATPWREQAIAVVREHLAPLAAKDFAALKRKTGLGEPQLAQISNLIQSLNPRPGAAIASGPADYVIPDLVVRRQRNRWVVSLNPEVTPSLRINSNYAGLVRRRDSSRQNTWLKEHLREARWFLKGLESRHDTLLRVATCIVEFQRAFLEQGEEAMRPLVLQDVAEAVEMHESTISRSTSRKYMQTPRGLFELKYFFSSHVGTIDGGAVSSTAIRALIRKITARENPRKPLSDSKIAAILAQRNINVARRTVAKYRESMSIPSSNRRKALV